MLEKLDLMCSPNGMYTFPLPLPVVSLMLVALTLLVSFKRRRPEEIRLDTSMSNINGNRYKALTSQSHRYHHDRRHHHHHDRGFLPGLAEAAGRHRRHFPNRALSFLVGSYDVLEQTQLQSRDP